MTRNFRISVNGKSYDVQVEELGQSGASIAPSAPAPAAPASTPAPVAAAAPTPAPAPTPASAPAGGSTITAPMPGKIWKMHVKEGDAIAEGQLALVLEAMKMENEIYAPVAGTVTQVRCKEGDSVNTGDALIVIS